MQCPSELCDEESQNKDSVSKQTFGFHSPLALAIFDVKVNMTSIRPLQGFGLFLPPPTPQATAHSHALRQHKLEKKSVCSSGNRPCV